jgi:hypothetical protein
MIDLLIQVFFVLAIFGSEISRGSTVKGERAEDDGSPDGGGLDVLGTYTLEKQAWLRCMSIHAAKQS